MIRHFAFSIRRVGNNWPGRKWSVLLFVLSTLLLLPLAAPLQALFFRTSETWQHFANTLLWSYARDTIVLCSAVLLLTTLLGVIPAWLLSRYHLPMSSLLETILIFPLALPAYITAYAYSGIFDFYGPLWNLGAGLGLPAELLGKFRITNMTGLVLVMSFALYPYVFLIMRNSFRFQVAVPLNVARSLGAGQFRQFFSLSLPLCRPALVGALAIVLMETLNEYGAAVYFGQNTLSPGIFRIWFGHYDLPAAQRLSGLLLVTVFIILALEHYLRGHRQYDPRGRSELEKIHCKPGKALAFFTISLLPALLGFLFPFLQLLAWALRRLPAAQWPELLQGLFNTLLLASLACLAITLLSILTSFVRRLEKTFFLRRLSDLSLLGHSLPGAVIALGMLGISQALAALGIPIILTGGLFFLLYAYVVRFLAISQRAISAGMSHQLSTQDEVSRSLGSSPWQTLLRVHLPNLRESIAGTLSIIFLEIVKELPLTIILRPFNFQTLAVHSYQLASNEMVQDAALPALLLTAIAICSLFAFRKGLIGGEIDG